MRNMIIFGASRGLGAAFNSGLPERGDTVWLVSRSQPERLQSDEGVKRIWVRADLRKPGAADSIAGAVGGQPLDVLIYNAGIWEASAFGPEYKFERVSAEENLDVLAVNLLSPVLCLQKLIPNLRKSSNAKVILIGSISGLENNGGREVAYDASKFGLRGAAHALREYLRKDRIAVTVLNPGSIDTDTPFEAGVEASVAASKGKLIPVHDLVAVVNCVINLSKATCPKEIDIPAMADVEA
ncbi:MAG: SDR family oxidoreductase [Chloroflexi bacterium]|nr:SDR family oxidoreductase [Chloroflexota bacterium]